MGRPNIGFEASMKSVNYLNVFQHASPFHCHGLKPTSVLRRDGGSCAPRRRYRGWRWWAPWKDQNTETTKEQFLNGVARQSRKKNNVCASLSVLNNTNHYNFSNVFKGTMSNTAILDRVSHKPQGLSHHAAQHLHLQQKKTKAQFHAKCQYT